MRGQVTCSDWALDCTAAEKTGMIIAAPSSFFHWILLLHFVVLHLSTTEAAAAISGGIVAVIAIVVLVIVGLSSFGAKRAWDQLQQKRGVLNATHMNPLYDTSNRDSANPLYEQPKIELARL